MLAFADFRVAIKTAAHRLEDVLAIDAEEHSRIKDLIALADSRVADSHFDNDAAALGQRLSEAHSALVA